MKRKVFRKAITLLCAFSLCACNNELSEEFQKEGNPYEHETTSGVLNFASDGEFHDAIKVLSTLNVEERKEYVASHFGNIKTLQTLYDEAMADAALLDESRAAYESFKNKYADYLFFADYKDDKGVYIPVSNEIVASLLNEKGEVCINKQIENKKDIFCYTQLQATGQAMYDADLSSTTRALSFGTNVGSEYDSGWHKENGKKIRLKCGRQVIGDSGILTTPVSLRLHVEISFRKHTWLGYINYSSHIDLNGTFSVLGVTQDVHESKTADSSHDYYYGLPYAIPVPYLNSYQRHAAPVSVDFTVNYRGMPNAQYYKFTLNEVYL